MRKKISDANKGRLSWNKNIPRTADDKIKIGVATKIAMNQPGMSEKLSRTIKLALNRPEVKKKCLASRRIVFNRPEVHKKMRLSAIKRISEQKCNGNRMIPSYNPIACKLIDEYGQQNGYNFQHALNGGEFFVERLGYWVDGYDKEKNVVIEYYEKQHRYKINRDEIRKQEIINHLNCKFIELKEWESK